jgi:hypothetical protein
MAANTTQAASPAEVSGGGAPDADALMAAMDGNGGDPPSAWTDDAPETPAAQMATGGDWTAAASPANDNNADGETMGDLAMAGVDGGGGDLPDVTFDAPDQPIF